MSAARRYAEALAGEVDRVAKLISTLGDESWSRPTRCSPLDVRELVTHMWRGAFRTNEMLDGGAIDEQPEADGVTYWHVVGAVPNAKNPAAPTVVGSAQSSAAGKTNDDIMHAWTRDWEAALSRARAMGSDDPVLRNALVKIRLGEYLRTRCLEVLVHHADVRDALGMDPDPDPTALEVVIEILVGLLGTDPRRLGFDEMRLVLAGTGRLTLNGAETRALGPLAKSFPLIV